MFFTAQPAKSKKLYSSLRPRHNSHLLRYQTPRRGAPAIRPGHDCGGRRHGNYGYESQAAGEQVETLSEGVGVVAVRIGKFTWDRDNRPEIGLLIADGSVRRAVPSSNQQHILWREWPSAGSRSREFRDEREVIGGDTGESRAVD